MDGTLPVAVAATKVYMIIKAVVPLLAKNGFRKRAGDVFTLDVAPGVLGWLGLNRATRHGAPTEVEVNPVVGVRFQNVEQLVAECRGEKFHAYLPPTISVAIGYLMPERSYRSWTLGPDCSDMSAIAMVAAIVDYGIPFMRSNSNIAVLRQRLEANCGFEHQLIYRRPAAALLAGDIEQARVLLDSSLAIISDHADLAATAFREFAETFRRRFLL